MAMIPPIVKQIVIVFHGEQSPGMSDVPVEGITIGTPLGQIPISQSYLATTQGHQHAQSLTPNFMMVSHLQNAINTPDGNNNTIVFDETTAPGGVFLSSDESNEELRDNCLKNPYWKNIVASAAMGKRPVPTPKGFAEAGPSDTAASFKGAGVLGTQIHEYSASGTDWFFDHLIETDYGDPTKAKGGVQEALADFGVFFLHQQQQLEWIRIMEANDPFLLTNGNARQIRVSDLMLHIIRVIRSGGVQANNVKYQFTLVLCNPPLTHSGAYRRGVIHRERLEKPDKNWMRTKANSFNEEDQKYWLMVFYTDFLRFYLYNAGKNQFLQHSASFDPRMVTENPQAPCSLHTTGRYAVMDDEERRDFIINIGNYLQFYPIWLTYRETTDDPAYSPDIEGIMRCILKVSTTPTFEQTDEGFWGVSQLTSYPEGYNATLSKHIFPKILDMMNRTNVLGGEITPEIFLYYNLLPYVNQKYYPGSNFTSRFQGAPSQQAIEGLKYVQKQVSQMKRGGKKHKSHIKRKKTKRRKKKSNKKSRRKKKTRKHRRKRKKTKLIYRR
jgi:hypothetical protein